MTMKQSPSWEANSHSSCQEIPYIWWEAKVHYSVHKDRPPVHILSHMHPIHIFPAYFPKIRSNIVSHLNLGFQSVLNTACFTTKILYAFLLALMRATWPTNLILLHLITVIIFPEIYKLWSSSLDQLNRNSMNTKWFIPLQLLNNDFLFERAEFW
jgi:hypothetical protein